MVTQVLADGRDAVETAAGRHAVGVDGVLEQQASGFLLKRRRRVCRRQFLSDLTTQNESNLRRFKLHVHRQQATFTLAYMFTICSGLSGLYTTCRSPLWR